jgi:hypothetical protein
MANAILTMFQRSQGTLRPSPDNPVRDGLPVAARENPAAGSGVKEK